MDHLADSIAELCQSRKYRYICREGVPMNDSPGEEYKPVVVSACLDLSVC